MVINLIPFLNQASRHLIGSIIKRPLKKNQKVKKYFKTSVDSNQFMIRINLRMYKLEISRYLPKAWILCLIMIIFISHNYSIQPNLEEISSRLECNHQWIEVLVIKTMHSNKWHSQLQVKQLQEMYFLHNTGKLHTMLLLILSKNRRKLSQDVHFGPSIVKHTVQEEADGRVNLLILMDQMDIILEIS